MNFDAPRTALIFGSCVSRDLARIDSERFKAGHYTARQSWISAYAESRRPPNVVLPSAFQKRMVEDDFRSSGRNVLKSTRPATSDLIMLDLIDERLGVLPVEGSWITMSNELRKSKAVDDAVMRQIVPFGSPEHFELWASAAIEMRADLDSYMGKTFVLAARFASVTDLGVELKEFRGESAVSWNQRFEPYYDYLRSIGFNVVDHDPEMVLSSEEHTWGATPFHYIDAAYKSFGDRLLT
ncbi:DUF6270 domain-containing protein [Paeniglutamicibacter sp.]|uniref:DUF6270 domain-containing protein n=1 Tax=Paeniglutamicibacter sp. TaxID=1934391 RepID=UPI0039897E98